MTDTIAGMNSIDESTKRIAEMVLAISDISDKVNLLALNASIEAARAVITAGDLLVVAEEISKLADQTAVSAKNITEIVNSGLAQVGRGKEYVEATAKGLIQLLSLFREWRGLFRRLLNQQRSSPPQVPRF
jgi:methyl-accepting chemotaxis protein